MTREPPLRLALAGTPRSGNSWVRHVLSAALGLENRAVHDLDDLPAPLPPRVLVQVHWDRTPEVEAHFDTHGFRVLTVSRHPLDILVSMLHFARHEPSVTRWHRGVPERLGELSPTSEEFAAFATSAVATELLSVTPRWFERPDTVRLRYEWLVGAPAEEFGFACRHLGGVDTESLVRAIDAHSLEFFRALPNRHGWRATPGTWRAVVTPQLARSLLARHRDSFALLGYACDPDPSLTPETAEANWLDLLASGPIDSGST